MPLPAVQITSVRQPQSLATALLRDFVLHGVPAHHAPRGIDPGFIAYWVPLHITAAAPPKVFDRLLELLLFYEQPEPLARLATFLTGQESNHNQLCRSLHIVRALAELGSSAHLSFAAEYFSRYLLPHAAVMPAFPLVLAAAEALGIDMEPIFRRVLSAPPDDNYTQYARALFPASLAASRTRRRLLAQPSLGELAGIYLHRPALSVFAARLLRGAAMRDSQPAVLAAFSGALDQAISTRSQQVHRAAEAILYCKGTLTFSQELAVAAFPATGAHFLSDN